MDALSYRFLLVLGAGLLVVFGGLLGFMWMTADTEVRSTSWELQETTNGGRTLEISYLGGKCDKSRRLEKDETTATVRVQIFVTAWLGCDDIAFYRTIEVGLDRPLDDRRLVDARTGRAPEFFSR